ncbi:hypothetical protein BUALT_Bualt14G0012900 [Buddleja alternifolia]|uniref:non-specific serine/threonine protein kinase n=1 Tax=Buddleja alternifolia TaxID=168488 RepID=A0AAV6WQZ2_9LAMI|nr:hypothetical protein BUALT_Bualt14G0012900 [Buddleja alternifolia]
MENSIIILPFLIFSCFALIIPATFSSNETDLLSLLAVKAAIDDPHGALNSWNETTHFCRWKGIRCGRRHPNRVVAINLISQRLGGSLSPHIGNLSFLRGILLRNNSFRGEIPQQIGFLRRLELVELSNNSFIGAIPRNLSRCPNLYYLNLIDNDLSGNIPHELGSLYKLEALGLGSNELSGRIPPSIGNLSSLTLLSLRFCGLKGQIPESLGQLRSLTYLVLGQNNFTGSIPSSLFNISTLSTFEVYYNQLQGSIPYDLRLTLPNLMYLHLGANQFRGPIPMSLSNASSLVQIQLTDNFFTGPVPWFGRLSRLLGLYISNNPIEDDINFIASLTNCTNLQKLDMHGDLLSGSLPHAIANLSSHLTNMVISSNQLHGEIPLGIENLVSLTRVDLSDNNLDGSIPLGIGKLSNVHELNLGANKFRDVIPSSMGNLTLLNILYLDINNFSGSIPRSLSNCTNLLELRLSSNNLNGLIPQEIMRLSSISISLNLSSNSFMGSIPLEVGTLINLENLDLSNNRLSGLIPSSLSNCISLQKLYLEGNVLEGQIPQGLSDLRGLQDLDLSRNNLSGPIPSLLGDLQLEKLNLSYNRLQGEVPMFRNTTRVSLDGNNELCGGNVALLKLLPCSSMTSSKKRFSSRLKILIPLVIVGCVICFALSAWLIIFLYRRRWSKQNVSSKELFLGTQFMRLSYAHLLKATNGFSETNLVGAGRFGSVYKGILDDGQTFIAVKVLNLVVKGASKSFLAECNALRGIRHRNLLKIMSVCESIDFQGNDFKALVYEFMANGSLEKWLYNNKEQEEENGAEYRNLDMIERLNIAIDIAHALEYMHFGTDSTIVHGDLKPSNILLDHNMTAYVGDFGLAKIVTNMLQSHDQSSSSIAIKGTVGYVAPEYGTSDVVSTQGDVYSYGILLLELFTNRRPTDDIFNVHLNLHNFVSNAFPDGVMEIVDPSIQIGPAGISTKITDCLSSILSIGVACSNEMPKNRMSMIEVVSELKKIRNRYLAADLS